MNPASYTVPDLSGYGGYTSVAGCNNTYECVRSLLDDGVVGDLVEVGVGSGSQIAVMLRALRDASAARTVRLFDSFQGIPIAGPRDLVQPGNEEPLDPAVQSQPLRDRLRSSGVAAHTSAEVRQFIQTRGLTTENCVFYEGWIQDTLPKAASCLPAIALLRIDVDLYESTYCALENLYPLLVHGGILILDDFAAHKPGYNQVRAAVTDYFSAIHAPLPLYYFPTDYGLAWCRK